MQLARSGSTDALGELLEHFRPYLLFIANQELSADLQSKIGGSDLVQETFIKAYEHFGEFNNHTEEEFQGWLRSILLNHLANTRRLFHGTQKRELAREHSLNQHELNAGLTDVRFSQPSPSSIVATQEADHQLQVAMQKLPTDYLTVVKLRSYERKSFDEISIELQRTPEAVRKLWIRAIERLQTELEVNHEST